MWTFYYKLNELTKAVNYLLEESDKYEQRKFTTIIFKAIRNGFSSVYRFYYAYIII